VLVLLLSSENSSQIISLRCKRVWRACSLERPSIYWLLAPSSAA